MITLLKPLKEKKIYISSSNKRQKKKKSVQGRDELPLGMVGRDELPLAEMDFITSTKM